MLKNGLLSEIKLSRMKDKLFRQLIYYYIMNLTIYSLFIYILFRIYIT